MPKPNLTFDHEIHSHTHVSRRSDYRPPFKFTGEIKKVTIDLAPEQLSAADVAKIEEGEAAIGVAQ